MAKARGRVREPLLPLRRDHVGEEQDDGPAGPPPLPRPLHLGRRNPEPRPDRVRDDHRGQVGHRPADPRGRVDARRENLIEPPSQPAREVRPRQQSPAWTWATMGVSAGIPRARGGRARARARCSPASGTPRRPGAGRGRGAMTRTRGLRGPTPRARPRRAARGPRRHPPRRRRGPGPRGTAGRERVSVGQPIGTGQAALRRPGLEGIEPRALDGDGQPVEVDRPAEDEEHERGHADGVCSTSSRRSATTPAA